MTRDDKLDIIRVVAMTMIVLCHYFQIIGFSGLHFWLNTGVQIFFVLSAFLLSNYSFTSLVECKNFLKKRIQRIMIPLWIYLVTIILGLLIIRYPVKANAVFMYAIGLAAFSPDGVLGLGHLWYITAILICYAMLPLLDVVLRRVKQWPLKGGIIAVIVAFWVALFWRFSYVAFGIDVAFFLLTTLYFKSNRGNTGEKQLLKWCCLPAVVLFILTIALNGCIEIPVDCYEIIMTATKCLMAVIVFCLVRLYFKLTPNRRYIRFFSDISYEIYLTHQFLILFANRIMLSIGLCGVYYYVAVLLVSVPAILINAVLISKLTRTIFTKK